MSMAVYSVPGFMGSGLRAKTGKGPIRKDALIWVSKTYLAAYLLDQLTLQLDGMTPATDVGLELYPSGLYPALEWTTLDNAINDGEHVSFDFTYDWRKDLRRAGLTLSSLLAIAAESDEYAVVCHSAGAAVALYAWSLLSPAVQAKCRRFVWMNPCLGGCYDSIQGLAGVEYNLYGFGVLTSILAGVIANLDDPLHTAPSQQQRLNRSVASWPAIYQLAPNPLGRWLALDPNLPAVYQQDRWADANTFVQQVNLDDGRAFQDHLQTLLSQPLPPSVVIRSGPQPTTFMIANGATSLADPTNYQASNIGDGVMEYSRMDLEGIKTLGFANDHPTIMGSPQLASRILAIIDNGLADNRVIPPPEVSVRPSPIVPVQTPSVSPTPIYPSAAASSDP